MVDVGYRLLLACMFAHAVCLDLVLTCQIWYELVQSSSIQIRLHFVDGVRLANRFTLGGKGGEIFLKKHLYALLYYVSTSKGKKKYDFQSKKSWWYRNIKYVGKIGQI